SYCKEKRRSLPRCRWAKCKTHNELGNGLLLLIHNSSSVSKSRDRMCARSRHCKIVARAKRHRSTLHPPLLDEMGLSSALEWYVDGFGKRSGILTILELASDFGRVNSDLEIAIFRLVQECLTNVHRHSGSSKAVVRLKRSRQGVTLEIEDEG